MLKHDSSLRGDVSKLNICACNGVTEFWAYLRNFGKMAWEGIQNGKEISATEARSQEYRKGSKKHMEICFHLAVIVFFDPAILCLEELSGCTTAVRSECGNGLSLVLGSCFLYINHAGTQGQRTISDFT